MVRIQDSNHRSGTGIYKIDHQVYGTCIFFPEMWSILFYPELGGKPAVIEALEGLKKAETEAEEAKQVGQRFLE